VRLGLPGRRDLRRGRRQHRGGALLARVSATARLPDQLPALHRLRPVHRGLPDPLADDDQLLRAGRRQPQDLIYTKEQLLAPLLPGMEQPPHPMRLGDTEQDYYVQGPTLAKPARRRSGGGAGQVMRARAGPAGRRGDHRRGRSSSGSSARSPWPRALGMVFARNAVHSALCLVARCSRWRLLHGPAGAVPRLRADHRLHRRGS
jgi:hypothetical protein